MATVFAFPVEENDLAAQEERLKGLETQTGNIRERLSKIEGRLETPRQGRFSHPLFIVIVSVIGAGFISYLGWLGVELHKQGEAIAGIKALLSPQLIQDAALSANNPESAKQALQALHTAISHGQHLDLKLVADAGEKFNSAAASNPVAWGTALAFASYRTAFNSEPRFAHFLPLGAPPPPDAYFDMRILPGPSPSLSYLHGPTPTIPRDAALMVKIGGNQDGQLRFGAVEMAISGGSISLDDLYYRHVLIKNTEVHYSGKPMVLEDVTFVNCTFIFDNTSRSREFAEALLTTPAINISELAA